MKNGHLYLIFTLSNTDCALLKNNILQFHNGVTVMQYFGLLLVLLMEELSFL